MLGWIGAALALGQTGPMVAEAQRGVFTLANGDRVEVLGVCSIAETGVRCWSPNGSDLPETADRIRDYYREFSGRSTAFRLGYKNRYLVFRQSAYAAERFSMDLPPHNGEEGLWQKDGKYLCWSHVALPMEAKSFDARISLRDYNALATVKAPFESGKRIEVEGYPYVFGIPEPDPRRMAGGFGGGIFGGPKPPKIPPPKWWRIPLIDSPAPPIPLRVDLTPYGHDGNVIRFVSNEGKPISEREYASSLSHINHAGKPMGPSLKGYDRAVFNVQWDQTLSTNIAPAFLAQIELSAFQPLQIWFRNLPLDPPPS